MAIKGILFDKDGTLIDFERTIAPGTVEVIEHLSCGDPDLSLKLAQSVDLDMTDQKFGPQSVVIAGTNQQIAELWHSHLPTWEIDALAKEVDQLSTVLTEKYVTPFADLDETLLLLQKMNIPLGVATNDAEASAHLHVKKMGHHNSFSFIAGYDSGHGAKPGPGMVDAFAKHINAKPNEIMMVGDSLHDLHSAKAAGAIAIAVTTGIATKDALSADADYVLSALGELPPLVTTKNTV